MKLLIALLTVFSVMAHALDRHGNIRLSLWDGTAFRSGIVVRGSTPFVWYRAHVSRDSAATFADSTAETVTVTFSNDTITEIR